MTPKNPKHPLRSPVPLLLSLSLPGLVLLGLATGCGGDGHGPGEPAQVPVVRAALGTAERTEIARRVEIQGTVEADQTSAVSTRVMARVTAVHVSAGDTVRRGQVLLEIDPQTAQGQLSQAKGGLAQAKAQLALAERNYRRFEELHKTRAASELELDQARTHYEQARGAVEQAEGAVAAASSMASDSTVRAPYSGRVVRRVAEVGDLAAPGRPLLTIQSGDHRRLVLAVPESVLSRSGLALGDEVPLEIGVRPELGTVTGTVVEMTPGADPLSHSFEVKVDLPRGPVGGGSLDGTGAIPTGVAGRAWLPSGSRTAITVPRDTVLTQGGMSLVVVRTEDGTARTRVVTLGARTDGRVEVLSGLEGDETVLRGLPTVPPSGAVVEEARSEAAPGDTAEPRIETGERHD
jgi:RND family efflux transporter MFP subunit